MKAKLSYFLPNIVFLLVAVWLVTSIQAAYPQLVITANDVQDMKIAAQKPGLFRTQYLKEKAAIDKVLNQPLVVPIPKDGGGGYTHERHKKNYSLMYRAGTIYQISGEKKYADYVRDLLLEYSKLYPTLDVHPARKVNAQNPGKLFWQSLNEAVWMVYTIQAYDMINESISDSERETIEQKLLRPYVHFLSDGQPSTFNKVHNHGTWATAAVGMAGYVMDEPEWVEKALYDLDKSGKGGFLKQLDILFSPDGYYTEGPYYQRYALFPFITFAKAIANNEPERKIFQYRDGVLLKAIDTTIQLSYNRLFFPINDAIKSKGIDTIELVYGVTVAYGLTQDPGYLDIAQQQNQIILTGDGLKVAEALDNNLQKPYEFKSLALGDGSNGDEGALVILRSQLNGNPAVLFKPSSQGLGHGHFDKLTWQFYDHGEEIVSDYGAARFLNVEAKFGGRYLPENKSYAKQTVAHNTVVVNEESHFNFSLKKANANAPTLNYFEANDQGSIANATISSAYEGVNLERTVALINLPEFDTAIALDIFDVTSETASQYDLPLHYQGHLIETNFAVNANAENLKPVGTENGYQHLWMKAQATPDKGLAKVSWLNDNGRFYTQTNLVNGDETIMFTQIGANDPNFNLRNEHGYIRRVENKTSHQFVSVLEPHGDYNPSKEFTLDATSKLKGLDVTEQDGITLVKLSMAERIYLVAINNDQKENQTFNFENNTYSMNNRLVVFGL